MYRLDEFMAGLERRNPAEPEFIQAAREVIESIIDVVNENPAYVHAKILERITLILWIYRKIQRHHDL